MPVLVWYILETLRFLQNLYHLLIRLDAQHRASKAYYHLILLDGIQRKGGGET